MHSVPQNDKPHILERVAFGTKVVRYLILEAQTKAMRTLKVGDNIWMISLGGVDSNIYVIGGCLMVDSGTGNHTSLLQDAFGDIGLSFDNITTIVNTHAHFDHIGGNASFKKAKILAHELSAKIIEDGDGKTSYAHWFGGELEKRKCVRLKDKDTLRAGNTKLDVIHTPGHSDGSICLLDKKSGVLFSGDVIFRAGTGRTDLLGGSDAALKETLRALSHYNVQKILPGHGEIIENGAEHIRAIVEQMR